MNREYSLEGLPGKPGRDDSPVIPRTVQRRWQAAGDVLRLMHTCPGITRAQAVERVGLSSASASELFDRLRGLELIAESPAPAAGRGRPTTVLAAAASGPLIAVVDMAGSGWRILLADLAGDVQVLGHGRYPGSSADRIVAHLADELAGRIERYNDRIQAACIAVAGTVTGARILQFAGSEPAPTDLRPVVARLAHPVPLLVGNDATLGGLAEARTGAASGCGSSVHILLTGGIGAVLVIDGQPVLGATGAAGEFGHLPFGDPDRRCQCGARGCWGTQLDGAALAAQCGEPAPADPAGYSSQLLTAIEGGTATTRQQAAAELAAGAFGRGIGALVNAHDPAVVTLGGLGPRLRAAAPQAFETAYRAALMAYRRDVPTPVRTAQHTDGPVVGAVSLAIDELTTPGALEAWSAR